MGKLQQLRAKALSLRGALAMGGAVVVAASMTQVVGTLAAPDAVRTAKLATSTENYYPTPLTSSVTCTTDPDGANLIARRARIDWAPVPLATGYRVEFINKSNGSLYREDEVGAGVTRISGVAATSPRAELYVRVFTRNGPAISSGFSVGNQGISFKDWVSNRTECEGSGGTAQANQLWENQSAWTPGVVPFAAGPGASMFTTLLDELNSEELLEPLPEGATLAELPAVDSDPEPAPSDDAKPTESETSTTAPSPTAPSEEAAPDTEVEDGSKGTSSSSSSTSTAPSTPATSTSGTSQPTVTATSSRAVPTTPKTTVSTTRTTTVDPQPTTTPPASTTTTTATTVRASVGDDPIIVGDAFARLDEVDGQPRLVITNGGTEVCTADVPGATRITGTAGKLTVTVDGSTRNVDLVTCKIG